VNEVLDPNKFTSRQALHSDTSIWVVPSVALVWPSSHVHFVADVIFDAGGVTSAHVQRHAAVLVVATVPVVVGMLVVVALLAAVTTIAPTADCATCTPLPTLPQMATRSPPSRHRCTTPCWGSPPWKRVTAPHLPAIFDDVASVLGCQEGCLSPTSDRNGRWRPKHPEKLD